MKEKLSNFLENLTSNSLADIDLGKFFQWDYLTESTPNKQFFYEQWIYVLVLLNWFLSIVVFKLANDKVLKEKPKVRFVKKVSFVWFTNTVFLLLYNLMRSEGVKFLSMRLFMVIILLGYVGIFVYAIYYWITKMPGNIEKYKQAKIRNKYQNR